MTNQTDDVIRPRKKDRTRFVIADAPSGILGPRNAIPPYRRLRLCEGVTPL